ncbi:rRNA biogenesis protein RRP5 [Magnolia sinica]|uniref:rRNA biogenesis protein RRP5 n=1 Tax=Magnolia sinica TaxID=86752 RepID=UPI0026594278|nr:rRNA biogenesis protein RRP5 [Magnolia sinica]
MAATSKKKKSPKANTKDGFKPKKTAIKSSKRRNKPEKDPKPESLSIPIEDDEPDFPRGGRSVLSRWEEDEVRAEVTAEFEAEERAAKKKKRSGKTFALEDDLGSLFGDGITGKLPRFANRITFKVR